MATDINAPADDDSGLLPIASIQSAAEMVRTADVGVAQDPIENSGCAGRWQKPFRFLDLHPELRNHIYDLAITSDTFMAPGGRSLVHRGGAGPTAGIVDPKTYEQALAYHGRKFFALTQVCQQLRKEFRPLYMNVATLLTRGEAQRFLKAFYPGCFANTKIAASVDARVIIYFPERKKDVNGTMTSETTVGDVAALLRLVRTAPRLRLRFDQVSVGIELNDLFSNSGTGVTTLKDHIDEITCVSRDNRPASGDTTMTFKIRFTPRFDRELLKMGREMDQDDEEGISKSEVGTALKNHVNTFFCMLFFPPGGFRGSTVFLKPEWEEAQEPGEASLWSVSLKIPARKRSQLLLPSGL